MAYFAKDKGKWRAQRRRGVWKSPLNYHLGYYNTKEEALQAETRFDSRRPPMSDSDRINLSRHARRVQVES